MTSILPDNRKPQPPAERIPGDFRRDSNGRADAALIALALLKTMDRRAA